MKTANIFRNFLVSCAAVTALGASFAQAQDDADDETVRATHAAAGEKSLRRQYAGGRDEEELTVQVALPQPVRSPDGVPGAPDPGAGAHD